MTNISVSILSGGQTASWWPIDYVGHLTLTLNNSTDCQVRKKIHQHKQCTNWSSVMISGVQRRSVLQVLLAIKVIGKWLFLPIQHPIPPTSGTSIAMFLENLLSSTSMDLRFHKVEVALRLQHWGNDADTGIQCLSLLAKNGIRVMLGKSESVLKKEIIRKKKFFFWQDCWKDKIQSQNFWQPSY